jgi:GT2 family glycosyltransferase
MSELKAVVVTPVHNRCDETIQFLESISNADTTGFSLHTIIVDDGSTDETDEVLRTRFPHVEIVKGDGTLWYTAGTNRGFEAALKHRPDYIFAVNNDSTFDPKCFRTMIECAQKHSRSIVGPLLIDRENRHDIFQVAPRWQLLKGGYIHWRKQTVETVPPRPFEVELIVGNCVLYPVKAIEEAGPMDEKRLPQFGDSEYTPRMRKLGWRLLIEPRAHVYCKPNDVIAGFRSLPMGEKFRRLFRDPTGPYSVSRRFNSLFLGAPNKLQGLLAVPIFYLRIFLGISQESEWGARQPEMTIAEAFADKQIDE